MSAYGFVEHLCTNGHYFCHDWQDDDPKECPFCKERLLYLHSVETTNGDIADEPGTMPAIKECIGFDDDWKTDHYGNKYAVKILRYKPIKHWIYLP